MNEDVILNAMTIRQIQSIPLSFSSSLQLSRELHQKRSLHRPVFAVRFFSAFQVTLFQRSFRSADLQRLGWPSTFLIYFSTQDEALFLKYS
jgi:hypothetical protein